MTFNPIGSDFAWGQVHPIDGGDHFADTLDTVGSHVEDFFDTLEDSRGVVRVSSLTVTNHFSDFASALGAVL